MAVFVYADDYMSVWPSPVCAWLTAENISTTDMNVLLHDVLAYDYMHMETFEYH